jgi:hypothetical protein
MEAPIGNAAQIYGDIDIGHRAKSHG